jgi:hypothetical protein
VASRKRLIPEKVWIAEVIYSLYVLHPWYEIHNHVEASCLGRMFNTKIRSFIILYIKSFIPEYTKSEQISFETSFGTTNLGNKFQTLEREFEADRIKNATIKVRRGLSPSFSESL